MCLKVIENGRHKDVHIKEGEVSWNFFFFSHGCIFCTASQNCYRTTNYCSAFSLNENKGVTWASIVLSQNHCSCRNLHSFFALSDGSMALFWHLSASAMAGR